MMDEIKAVLKSEKMKSYPSMEDIEDRARLYEIKL
jgi:hypothetical protein